MIKTIKVKKQLRLDELIKYIFENGIKGNTHLIDYQSNLKTNVFVDFSGQVAVQGSHFGNELFTVEVEEAITEDTRFKGVQEIYIDAEGLLGVAHHPIWAGNSINDVLGERDEETECLYIYAAADGKTELIWEAE